MKGQCSQCGPERILQSIADWSADNLPESIKWKEWTREKETVNGKEISRMKLVVKKANRQSAHDILKQKLVKFGSHCFHAKWQFQKYRDNLENLGDSEAVAVLDFAENYTCTQQEEAQSAYYCHNSVTLHPVVVCYKSNGTTIRDSVALVSNDLNHDAAAVHSFVTTLLGHLRYAAPQVTRLYMWSDGCAAQYKSRQPFANLAQLYGQSTIKIEWNYFGSRHGKGPSDGESGVIKSKVSRLVLSGQEMVDNAQEFFEVCARHLTVIDGKSLRHIYFVPKSQIDECRATQVSGKQVKGCRGIHSIRVNRVGTLSHRIASCFCTTCTNFSQEDRSCPYGVPKWSGPMTVVTG